MRPAMPRHMTYRERALALFPAGSNGEYDIADELIPVNERGEGSRVWDADGREFLDMTMAWGAALVGHAHPKVIEAASRQAAFGANFAAVNSRAVELAERIAAISPCVERIRFVASGTEATMLCLRVAHAATGRPKVLKFEGAYHGQHPVGVAQEFYGVAPDLVAYGKALGGGFPLGAYGGRADLMEVVSEHRLPGPRYAWSASTAGGNPVSCAAALATLDLLSEPGTHTRLHAAGRLLRQRLGEALAAAGEAGQVLGDGPIAQVAFSSRPVTDQPTWLASDRVRGRLVMLELLRRGVFLNPMGTKLYLSLAHTES